MPSVQAGASQVHELVFLTSMRLSRTSHHTPTKSEENPSSTEIGPGLITINPTARMTSNHNSAVWDFRPLWAFSPSESEEEWMKYPARDRASHIRASAGQPAPGQAVR
ncbi:hypothetical protein S40293_10659 [Stachybotrys chartarum IBT 40293]|nr:hypothetical protein S40293_10659 [Stachybotrys chartarum IBT 40293]